MATIASLVVQIGADVAGIRTGIDQANAKMDSFASKAMAVGKAVAATAVFAVVADGIRDVVAAASEIDELAGRIDDTAANVQKLQAVANDFDVEVGSLVASIQEMQSRLGDGKLDESLAKLNLHVGDFKALSPTEQFLAVADALGKIQDPAERAARAKEALGKSAKAVSSALREGVRDTQAWVSMSEETVSHLDTLAQWWDKAKMSAKAFGAEVLTGVTGLRHYHAIMEQINALRNKFDGQLPTVPGAPGGGIGGIKAPNPSDVKAFTDIEEALTRSAQKSIEINKTQAQIEEKAAQVRERFRESVTYFNTADNLGTEFRATMADTGAEIRDIVANAGILSSMTLPEAAAAASELRIEMEKVGAVFSKTSTPVASGGSGGVGLVGAEFGRNLSQSILRAYQGGGDIGRTIGADLGGQIGTHLGEKLGEKVSNAIGGKVGSAIGGMAGAFLGPLGSMAGAWLGGKIGNLFSGGEGKKVNDMRDQFVAAAGGIHELNVKAQEAGLTLDKLLKAKSVKDFEAAVGELNGAFGDQESLLARGLDAMDRYGISIEMAGQKFKQTQMNASAESLIEDFRALMNVGVDLETVIDKMGPAVGRYVQQSIEMGVSVPREMQGIISKMIDAGTLVDANGDKFTELGQIPFADSINEGLTDLIKKLDLLLTKIGVDLPNVISKVPSLPDIDPGGLLEGGGVSTQPAGSERGADSVVHVHIDNRGALLGDYASQQRLADIVSEALVGRAELRGRISFAGAGV